MKSFVLQKNKRERNAEMKSLLMVVAGLALTVANGIPLNPSYTPEVVREYKEKADAGDAEAQATLGSLYESGLGVEKDEACAVKWYRSAAELGSAEGQYCLGRSYELGRGVKVDCVAVAKWYKKAAEQGHVQAQVRIGRCYARGWGVEKNVREAMKWYLKAAAQGSKEAIEELKSFGVLE